MIQIHCTQKLQKAANIEKIAQTEGYVDTSVLGSWHANLIEIKRCHCILFANDKTLFNFIIADIPKINAHQLEELFRGYLRCVLAEEGFSQTLVDRLVTEYADIQFVNTNNKRVLGSMNELAFMYTCYLEEERSVHSPQLPEIIKKMNRVIMGMLGSKSRSNTLKYPIDVLRDLCDLPQLPHK